MGELVIFSDYQNRPKPKQVALPSIRYFSQSGISDFEEEQIELSVYSREASNAMAVSASTSFLSLTFSTPALYETLINNIPLAEGFLLAAATSLAIAIVSKVAYHDRRNLLREVKEAIKTAPIPPHIA